jgi:hypothetical protein
MDDVQRALPDIEKVKHPLFSWKCEKPEIAALSTAKQ